MSKQTGAAPAEAHPNTVQDILFELIGYAALLNDLTARTCTDGVVLSDSGLSGLNRLARHMHTLAVDAMGNVPLS